MAAIAARQPIGEFVIAVGVLALSGVVAWQASVIPTSPMYAEIGPKFFPYAVSIALAALGLALLVGAASGGWQPREETETKPDKQALGFVMAGILANIVLIGSAGFTIAAVALFVGVARGFGSSRPMQDLLVGSMVAIAAYLGFAKTLGINIGSGLVENGLEAGLTAIGWGS